MIITFHFECKNLQWMNQEQEKALQEEYTFFCNNLESHFKIQGVKSKLSLLVNWQRPDNLIKLMDSIDIFKLYLSCQGRSKLLMSG